MFLETYPFLLGCRICRHIIVHSIPLWFFVFLPYRLLCLVSHFLFFWFGFSFFSSCWAWPEVCQSCLSFQRTSSWFYWVFLISILFISSLIFIISFLLLILGFVLFIILLGGRLGCLFEIFLVFWGRPVSLWTSL